MATISKDDVLDAISGMTVIELKELLDAFEEKFGVTAAAPVMMSAGPAAAAADLMANQTANHCTGNQTDCCPNRTGHCSGRSAR